MLAVYYKTIFRNQQTGETEFLVTPKEACDYSDNGILKCKGKIGFYLKNMPIYIDGTYNTGENAYMVSSDSMPFNTEENTIAILEYITEDLTENQKKEIAKCANNDLFTFVTQKGAADALMKVFRGKEKAAKMAKLIINKVKKLKEKEDITKELMSYNMPIDRIELLYKKEITLQMLDKNPYTIMLKFGIPIDCIELYAIRRLQMPEYSIERLGGFLLDAMMYITKSGHTCCTLSGITKIMNMRFKFRGAYLTRVDEALVNLCVEMMSDELAYREVNGVPYIYLHHIWEEETKSLSHLRRLQSNQKDFSYSTQVSDVETAVGITYNSGQKNAFNALNKSGVKILTGPPGSGKTATIKGLIHYFTSNNNGIVKLAATTGMASKVMAKACGDDAETVNIMLNVRPFDNSVQGRDLNNPVEADLIIVDEVSMLGLQLFSVLVGAVKSGSILLLVGDEDQLQSVEYGNVLHDLISSGYVEVYRLTEILRQSGTICDNAQKINRGEHNLKIDSSFQIMNFDEPQDAIDELKKYFVKNKSQILSPTKKGPIGTSTLNSIFQNVNAPIAATYGKKIFRIGDKVIMTKTNYDKGYINGDIGYIIGKNDDETIVVNFQNRHLTIERQDMMDMELADAITIHKSQGSECDDIHIMLPAEAVHMTTRRILYTGVTRAKQTVRIYEINHMSDVAIDDKSERKRLTLLSERISPPS